MSDWTVDDVREMRRRTGRGMAECIRVLTGRKLRARLESAQTLDDVKKIVLTLIDDRYPDHEQFRKERDARFGDD